MTTAAYIPHSSNEPMAMPPAPLFKGAAEKRQCNQKYHFVMIFKTPTTAYLTSLSTYAPAIWGASQSSYRLL